MLDIQHPPLTDLPAATPEGVARQAALEALGSAHYGTAGFVDYQAGGCLLILGPAQACMEAARVLSDQLSCFIVADDQNDAPADLSTYLLARGQPRVSGYLGAFEVWLDGEQGPVNVAALTGAKRTQFDVILDLGAEPAIAVDKPPLGYQRPGAEPAAIAEAIAQLPDWVGEFQKPRFFAYDETICAHGARGMTGCTRCLDACATGAITSLGERVEIDPYLCQGCGSCAVVCPSGAMSYAFPAPRDLLGGLRRALRAWDEHSTMPPALLFHDDENGAEAIQAAAADLPETLIPVPVEDGGSVGPDIWLTALAMGVTDIIVWLSDQTEASLLHASQTQLSLFAPVLQALGLEPERVSIAQGPSALAAIQLHPGHGRKTSSFSIAGGKRERLQTAFTQLYRPHRDTAMTELPVGAPFGQIVVDQNACTLCMACAAVCPVEAVTSGGTTPQLLFDESRCLQCGLCERGCPEDAIQLQARLHLPAFASPSQRVLNEETPFHCVGCGKAFATEKMIARVGEQLAGHWMFQDERARRRLEMCEDCRVKDLFDEQGDQIGH